MALYQFIFDQIFRQYLDKVANRLQNESVLRIFQNLFAGICEIVDISQ